MDANGGARVVLVHDWLTGMRGGEKCLEVLCRRWPRAKLYTLLHRRGAVSPAVERLRPRASFLNRLPGVHDYYRWLLPLMPVAAASLSLPACDLVVSFSHCAAKGVRVPRGAVHVCYCFTPMRYAWHMRDSYFGRASFPNGILGTNRLLDGVLERLRQWDRRTAAGVTHFLAISKTVQSRIDECYNRDSTVIYPPVDTDFYRPADEPAPREDFYLVVSAFAPYKRLDLAVTACERLGRPLVVVGTGQDEARLRRAGGAGGALPGLAAGRGHPRPDAALQGAAVPRRGGFRHRAGGGDGVRDAGDRLRPRRRDRDGDRAGRPARTDGAVLRGADGRLPGRRDDERSRCGRTSSRRRRPGGRRCASTSNVTKRKWSRSWPGRCGRRRRRRGGRREESLHPPGGGFTIEKASPPPFREDWDESLVPRPSGRLRRPIDRPAKPAGAGPVRRTPARPAGRVVRAHADLFAGNFGERMRRLELLRQNRDILALVDRQHRVGEIDSFLYGSRRYDSADARRMLTGIDRQLDEEERWWADFDRRVFRIHYQMVRDLGAAVARDLRLRYEFHLGLQDIEREASRRRRIAVAGRRPSSTKPTGRSPTPISTTCAPELLESYDAFGKCLHKACRLTPPTSRAAAGPAAGERPVVGNAGHAAQAGGANGVRPLGPQVRPAVGRGAGPRWQVLGESLDGLLARLAWVADHWAEALTAPPEARGGGDGRGG